MTASGTAGHGAEFANYLDPASLGAVVVKSMKADEWAGKSGASVHPTASGMINSVGLQGKGVPHWLEHDLPDLLATARTVVASIWGSSVDDYARAAAALAAAPEGVVAVEVNVSCPNLEDRGSMFAHSRTATAEVIEASTVVGRPMWAKLSPNAADLPEIAEAAHARCRGGGAHEHLARHGDRHRVPPSRARREEGRVVRCRDAPGGRSGRLRCARGAARPPDRRCGGTSSGTDVVEFLLAGASAVEVGTATFADPRAPGGSSASSNSGVNDTASSPWRS